MQRIILTLDQARILQHQLKREGADPLGWDVWRFALQPERPKPDATADRDRMTIALGMMRLGCSDEQVAEQLTWKPHSMAIRACRAATIL